MTVTQQQAPCGPIQSNQLGPHKDLERLVAKHRDSHWRQPIPGHTRRAAEEAMEWLNAIGRPPLVLDSFCGTGMSTATLAATHPEAAIIGIDQSKHRLGKHEHSGDRYRLFRAECEPFWRCLLEANVFLQAHYILYPNPWPKSSHFKRRVHGHPAFPLLAQLQGRLELRSNWKIYVEEFEQAAALVGIEGDIQPLSIEKPITLFERKYSGRGEQIWCFKGSASVNNA